MDKTELDGTRVLELLAEIDGVEDFRMAVDEDDFAAAARLMRRARVHEATIAAVLREMMDEDAARRLER